MSLKILVLEPYYGGSHKSFLLGLSQLPFKFEIMTLPARKWKWRMRLSAPYFAKQLREKNLKFDRILCSSYVDIATFRGLGPSWVRKVPLLTYFHENQFAYPVRKEDERDFHFGLTNVTTALASDRLAFNSSFNLRSFLDGAKKLLNLSYDMKLNSVAKEIRSKSTVLPPGLDFSSIDKAHRPEKNHVPIVLWNHRWEHDKNPEQFFEALFELDAAGLEFKVIVLGESFKSRPQIFNEARHRLSHRLIYYGYAKSQVEYAKLLASSDIVISTAQHEFFGLSVLEAVRARCRPLLPNRLSYPEIFPERFLYEDGELAIKLKELLVKNERLPLDQARKITDKFSWNSVAADYISWISSWP